MREESILGASSLRLPAKTMALQTQPPGSRRFRRSKARGLSRYIAGVRQFFAELTSSYHPERHYLRGGGTGGVA